MSSPVRTTFAASSSILNYDPCHFESRRSFGVLRSNGVAGQERASGSGSCEGLRVRGWDPEDLQLAASYAGSGVLYNIGHQDVVATRCLFMKGTPRNGQRFAVSRFLPWQKETEAFLLSSCTGVGSQLAEFPIELVYL